MPDAATRSPPPVPASDWMKVGPSAMRFVLHGDTQVRSAAAAAWQVEFAEEACRARVRAPRATLWMGPDEYLLLGFDEAAKDATLMALQRALGDMPHALVDVSHRQFALEVSGPHATDILSGACPLDLDLGEFPVNMCTRTVLAKADVLLWRTREDAFHLEVWRSFSGYVTGLLGEIAMEFHGG